MKQKNAFELFVVVVFDRTRNHTLCFQFSYLLRKDRELWGIAILGGFLSAFVWTLESMWRILRCSVMRWLSCRLHYGGIAPENGCGMWRGKKVSHQLILYRKISVCSIEKPRLSLYTKCKEGVVFYGTATLVRKYYPFSPGTRVKAGGFGELHRGHKGLCIQMGDWGFT